MISLILINGHNDTDNQFTYVKMILIFFLQVINGLMNRDDWQDAIKTPIGCIPGGSGNALACSINYSAG
jgi:hypothetical protein